MGNKKPWPKWVLEKQEEIECACGCGKKKLKYDRQGRESKYIPGHSTKRTIQAKQEEIECACGCGEKMLKYDQYGRERKYLPGHSNTGKVMPQRGRPLLKIRSENHWNWQGGKSQDRRDTLNTENNTWRKRVFKRDKYTCKLCGLTSYDGIRLNAHHIRPYKDYNHLRLDVSNGITLCHECHLKTFGKEDDFIDLFSALIANRVNCGDTRPSEVEGNPQPSLGGNTEEGSETRGRDYDLGELEPLRSKMVPCKMCGKMHAKPPHKLKANNNNFCSNECRNKWLGENSVFATDNPNKKAKTEVSCEWCGKKILLSPWQIKKSEHFFCCRPHYWLWKKGRLPKLSQ